MKTRFSIRLSVGFGVRARIGNHPTYLRAPLQPCAYTLRNGKAPLSIVLVLSDLVLAPAGTVLGLGSFESLPTSTSQRYPIFGPLSRANRTQCKKIYMVRAGLGYILYQMPLVFFEHPALY